MRVFAQKIKSMLIFSILNPILVPLWFIIISLVFFYLCKVLFSGYLQFEGNFMCGQNIPVVTALSSFHKEIFRVMYLSS